MLQTRTLKFLAALVALLLVLLLPGKFWPGYLDSPVGIVVAIPYLSIYLFHSIGVPGLLQHNGMCGWGWCPPTVFGWVFLGGFWGIVVWLLAWAAASITSKPKP